MTGMITINNVEFHVVPSRRCKSYGVSCEFDPAGDCRERLRLCCTVEGAPANVIFIHPVNYMTWLTNRIKGVE